MSAGRGHLETAAHPPLAIPAADWAWLRERCQALELPDPDPWRSICEALYGHMVGVNAWMNLTRITDARDYCKRHLLDSFACLKAPCLHDLAADVPCVDLGSGGGYPGLPLMTALATPPWVLVDSRRKKAAFLSEAIALTPARDAEARHFRGRESASAAPDLHGSCQLVVARAVGQADLLIQEAVGLLERGGWLLLPKGPAYRGAEHERALAAARVMSLDYVGTTELALEAGDPSRLLVAFRKRRV
ncbi:MAG: 16S rRNA (guanine(527)-N(7))-methyltransferase RsmG [Planctomycetota bacterium]